MTRTFADVGLSLLLRDEWLIPTNPGRSLSVTLDLLNLTPNPNVISPEGNVLHLEEHNTNTLGSTVPEDQASFPAIPTSHGLHSYVYSEPLKVAVSDIDQITSGFESQQAAMTDVNLLATSTLPSVSPLLTVAPFTPVSPLPIASSDVTTSVAEFALDGNSEAGSVETSPSVLVSAITAGKAPGIGEINTPNEPVSDASEHATGTHSMISPDPTSDGPSETSAQSAPNGIADDINSASPASDEATQAVLNAPDGSAPIPPSAAAGNTAEGASTTLVAPIVPHSAGVGDIVGLVIQNTSSTAEAARTITFSEIFAKGDVLPGSTLVAKFDDQVVGVQMDVKSTNDDGSVRQALITMQAPSIAAHSGAAVMLAIGNAANGPAISAQSLLNSGYDLKVSITIHGADGTTTSKVVDSASVLQQSISNGSAQTWLHGPLAGEYITSAEVAPNLSVTFDTRQDSSGQHHTDITLSRDVAYTTDVSTLNYDVAVSQGSQTVFSAANISQYAFSTWSTQVNSSGSDDPHVVYDMQYLINTGAIPSYDLNVGLLSSALTDEVQLFGASSTAPLGTGTISTYMGQTGGRADIGITPTWTAEYIVSQAQDAEKVMLGNANAAGSVPWHLVDDVTGQPVSLIDHPRLWIDGRGQYVWDAPDNLPVAFNPSGPFELDTAHQPSLSYVPYLMSGSPADLANLKAQASYIIASNNPSYRGATGDLIPDVSQVRAIAWDLRDIGDAAYALPDTDPMKAYFTKVVNDNLQHIIDTYVKGPAGSAEGQLQGWLQGTYGNPGNMAPWQQDFFAITMEHLAEQGFSQAHTILQWEDNFISGRFLAASDGFSAPEGLAYNLTVANSATGENYTTWQQVFSASTAGLPENTIAQSYSDTGIAGGYAAIARAGLASMISGTESVHAIQAYAWLVSQTPEVTAAFDSDPTWDIVPRLSDGSYLTNDKIQIGTSPTGSTLSGGDQGSLLVGGNGNDALVGGSGIDILMGGAGHQTLQGNAGDDYIFLGTGAETIDGGDGNDTIVMNSASSGSITVDGGSGIDTLELSGNYSDYRISLDGSTQDYLLVDQRASAGHGTVAVRGVETFQFSDGAVASDTLTSGTDNTSTIVDTANDFSWASQTTIVDAKGSLQSQSIVNDNGTRWVNTYDTTSTQTWLWKSASYDGAGAERTEVQAQHDGTYQLTIFDAGHQYAWSNVTYMFDAAWNQTRVTVHNDDGSSAQSPAAGSELDVTTWYITPYDASANGAPQNLVLNGGANADVLFGFSGNDSLDGGDGNDVIVGGRGNDLEIGGLGHDSFVFHAGDGSDVIADFTSGIDQITLAGFGLKDFASLQSDLSQVGGDTMITFDSANHVLLQHVSATQLSADDFLFS